MRHEATINGLNISYQRAGEGTALVLLHGFIADSRVWRTQIESLADKFEVIAWDAPGCGQSADPPEEFSMAEYADCLEGLLNATSIETAHILGLSWGGTLALEMYRRHADRIQSMVLANTYAGWTGSLGEEAARQRLERCLAESQLPAGEWVPDWVPDAFSGAASQELLDELAGIMFEFHPVGFRAMSRAVMPDFCDILPSVRVPTLLIWGDEDKRSHLSVGEEMRDRIPGARLAVLPGTGHVSNMEQPKAFNATVREFCLSAATTMGA